MNTFNNFIDKSNGIFLLILALCGNFLAETLSCKLQKVLTNNRLLKYLVVYFTIYFSITITSNQNENPFKLLGTAGIIWVIFIFFTRMTPTPTLIAMISLLLIYFINNYIEYKNNTNDNDNRNDNINLRNIQKLLLIFFIITIIIGNYFYLNKKISQYGKKFKYSTYIFGVQKCHSLD